MYCPRERCGRVGHFEVRVEPRSKVVVRPAPRICKVDEVKCNRLRHVLDDVVRRKRVKGAQREKRLEAVKRRESKDCEQH